MKVLIRKYKIRHNFLTLVFLAGLGWLSINSRSIPSIKGESFVSGDSENGLRIPDPNFSQGVINVRAKELRHAEQTMDNKAGPAPILNNETYGEQNKTSHKKVIIPEIITPQEASNAMEKSEFSENKSLQKVPNPRKESKLYKFLK